MQLVKERLEEILGELTIISNCIIVYSNCLYNVQVIKGIKPILDLPLTFFELVKAPGIE